MWLVLAFFLAFPVLTNAQFVISPGTSVTLKTGAELFVDTTMTILSNDTSSGHFCDQNPVGNLEVTGNVTVERYFTAEMWHNCASPVNGNQSSVYTGTDLVFYYDETIIENDWEFGWVFYDGPLQVMKGYDVYMSQPATASYSSANSNGLNSGSYSIGVTRTNPVNGEIESRKGWNLIGNPYPSPLDWLDETGWDKSAINDAKYIWDHQNQNYTIFIGGNNPLGLNGGTRYIPANQGFWVQATGNGNLQVNNAARRGIMEDTPGYYKESNMDYPMLCLRLESGGRYDETIVRFLPAATSGFDAGLDAFPLRGRAGASPHISSVGNRDKYAINSLPEIGEDMKIDLLTEIDGSDLCTLSMANRSTLSAYAEVFIEDRVTKTIINPGKNPEYNFSTGNNGSSSRFVLHINPSKDFINNITPDNAYFVYASDGIVFVHKNTSSSQTGKIYIFDIYGKRYCSNDLPDREDFSFVPGCKPGYYIIKISTEKFQISAKIWISRK